MHQEQKAFFIAMKEYELARIYLERVLQSMKRLMLQDPVAENLDQDYEEGKELYRLIHQRWNHMQQRSSFFSNEL